MIESDRSSGSLASNCIGRGWCSIQMSTLPCCPLIPETFFPHIHTRFFTSLQFIQSSPPLECKLHKRQGLSALDILYVLTS